MRPHDLPHYILVRQMPPVIVWGGLEKLMVEWMERIDYTRCRVTLIVSTGGGDVYQKHIEEKKLPVEVIEFPFRVDFRYTSNFFVRLIQTWRLLRGLSPETVIFFQGSFVDFDLSHILAASVTTKNGVYMHENLGAPVPAPKSSKKYLGIIPGVGLWWYGQRYLTPLRARFSRKILVVSREIKERMVQWWHYPQDKVDVLYHGVNIERFYPSDENRKRIREQMSIPDSDTVMIVAARLSQEKCINRAIDAFDALWRDDPKLRLLIAGTGPREEELKTLAGTKTSRDRIKFLGQVGNVHELYQLSDIYILSSDNEGLSLAFLEAMASGLICVVTDCTGTTEVIKDGINGFLVGKSTDGLLQGLQRALSLSADERLHMAQNATSDIRKNFEINRNIERAMAAVGLPHRIKSI